MPKKEKNNALLEVEHIEEPLEGTHSFLLHNIPDELKQRFKIKCLKRGTTMRQCIIQMMTDYCSSSKKERN